VGRPAGRHRANEAARVAIEESPAGRRV